MPKDFTVFGFIWRLLLVWATGLLLGWAVFSSSGRETTLRDHNNLERWNQLKQDYTEALDKYNGLLREHTELQGKHLQLLEEHKTLLLKPYERK